MAENVITKNSVFFAELLSPSAAKWSAGVAFDRSNGLPLDQWSVFQSEAKAVEYLSNAKAYPGQIIAYSEADVYEEDGTTLKKAGSMVACVLSQNAAGTALELKPIGIIPTGDNKTIEVSAEGAIALLGAKDAANGTLPMIDSETGKLVWRTLEDIGAGDGNDNTTYEFSFTDEKITIKPLFNGQPIKVKDEEGNDTEVDTVYELDLSVFATTDEVNSAIQKAIEELPEDKDTLYTAKADDKVLSLNGTEFSTQIGLKHENGRISLTGIDGAEIAGFSDADFIEDGFLQAVELVDENPNLDGDDKTVGGPFLKFTWNTASSLLANETYVAIGELVDVYTAGDGLKLDGNKFSIKVAEGNETFLTVNENGVKLSGVQTAIDAALQSAKDYADGKEHKDTTYTVSTSDTDKKVNVILTPSEGEAQTIELNAYNTTELDKMLYEGKYDETVSNIPTDKRANARLISEDEIKKLAGLSFGDNGEVGISGTVSADKVTGLSDAIDSRVTGANALNIARGAQVNVIETVKVNGTTLTITDKAVDVTVPTDVKDLADADKKYVTNVRMREAEEGYSPVLSINKSGSESVIDDSAIQATIKTVKDTADKAVKTISLTSGTENGTLKLTVDSTTTDNIAVKGLGGAAFKAEDYYQVAGNYQPAGSYKTTQVEKNGALTGAQVVNTWTQNTNGELTITTRDLTPADIGAQPAGNYKTKQTAVTDPTATTYSGSTLSYIETLTQDENGVISATKRSFDLAAYIDQKIGDSTNIMNFRGVVEETEAGFDIDIGAITSPQNGDVVLYGDYEYIYNGTKWEQFGDATGAIATAKTYTDEAIAALFADTSNHKASNTAFGVIKGDAKGVNIVDGKVASISTDLLVNGDMELVMMAGNASGYTSN